MGAVGACGLWRVGGLRGPGSFGPGSFGPGSFGPGCFGPGSFGPGSFGPGSFGPGSFEPGSFGESFGVGGFGPGLVRELWAPPLGPPAAPPRSRLMGIGFWARSRGLPHRKPNGREDLRFDPLASLELAGITDVGVHST